MNKLKKISIVVLSIFVLFIIASCSHTHTFDSAWSHDETYHFHKATCGHDEVSDKAEHTFGDWVTKINPTTDKEGSKERICTVCGYAQVSTIPKVVLEGDITKSGIYTGDYYSSITSDILNNKDTLRSTLTTLVNTNYVRFSYSGENGTVGKLKLVDSYDNDYVECIYTGLRIEKANTGSNTGSWNKEHIWAKSHGFNDEKYDAYSDMHHLRVSEANINSKRSNSYFAKVNEPTSTDSYGNKWTTTVFEPRDEVKGDIARMLFYMTVKYNGTESKDGLNLVLKLTDDASLIYSDTNTGANNYGGVHYLGLLSELVKWHYQDPVDEREIFRNNQIYSLQLNRNPFIDHPEYVYYLYTDESKTYVDNTKLNDLNNYVASNATALATLEALVDSIGDVTLEKEEVIKNALDMYDKLGDVSKSFFKKYRILTTKAKELESLKSQASQDKTKSTTISFLNLANKDGIVVNNGVSVDYTSPSYNASYGINAQGTSQGTKPAVLNVTGLYTSIKNLKFIWNTNHKGDTTAEITVTDGSNTIKFTSSNILYSSTEDSTYTLSLAGLDLTKKITITIKNNSSNSVRIKSVTFEV